MYFVHPALHPCFWAWHRGVKGHHLPSPPTPTGWPRRGHPTSYNMHATLSTGEYLYCTHSWKLIVHANVLCVVGIHGDKRLLTKHGMKISRSFSQVRHALYWQFFVNTGSFSVSLPLSEPQWATRRATGVTLWRGSLLKMKKLAKSWVTTLSASSWTEKRGLMWTRSTWPLFRWRHSSCSSCIWLF